MPAELKLTDLCPDGIEHSPVVETEELSTEFWLSPQTTIKYHCNLREVWRALPPAP
jgi:hypothetical protein